jgi:hypothetical protein
VQNILLAGVASFLLCVAPALGIETVRVSVDNGAPRILVDGTAVRARIFFGGPGRRPIEIPPIGPQGRQVTFDFTAGQDTRQGTMHFRFGDTPGNIYLGNVHMVDADTGAEVIRVTTFGGGAQAYAKDWSFWPAGSFNTVATLEGEDSVGPGGSAALHIQLHAPPDGKWPGFHFFHIANLTIQKDHHYRISFWARSDSVRQFGIGFYEPGTPFRNLAANVQIEEIKLAAAAGINFVSFPIAGYWPKPGAPPDWTDVDSGCQEVLDANPRALLIPRIGVYAPDWWLKEHPGEAMMWDAPTADGPMFDVASSIYRHDAAKNLRELIIHLEAKFGPHMAGYHICGQNTAEWFYFGTWSPELNGYSTCDQYAWRAWLKARYGNDDALRAAWHDTGVSIQTAAVPSPEARRAAPAGILRDPQTEEPVIDFTQFQQESMASCVCELAHVAREASNRKKLILCFYGYLFEFGSVHNGPGTSGHYGLRQVLNCPDIDILCSPVSYFDRGLGGNAPAMTAAESVALAGKMYLEEDDTRTYLALSERDRALNAAKNIEETNQLMVRDTAQCALRNFATWWMDLAAVGWFDDPRIWAQMARLKALDQPLLDHPTPYRPAVAAVIDPDSMMRVAYGGSLLTGPGVAGVRADLGRMGCPFGQYLQDDVAAGNVPAKLYVFLTAWHVSPEQRRQLLDKTRGATTVWCYAPGYLEGDHTSLDAMRELTGFQIKQLSNINATGEVTDAGNRAGIKGPLGLNDPVQPLFAAADATPGETLATYPNGAAAIAIRRTANGISIFVGTPGLTPELLRFAAQQSGIHLFTHTNCNVYANGPFMVLHGAENGPVDIDTGKSKPIVDMMTGRVVGKGPHWSVSLAKGETRVLKIGDFAGQ